MAFLSLPAVEQRWPLARTVTSSQSAQVRPLVSLITGKLLGLLLDFFIFSLLQSSQHGKQLSSSWPSSGIPSPAICHPHQYITSSGRLCQWFNSFCAKEEYPSSTWPPSWGSSLGLGATWSSFRLCCLCLGMLGLKATEVVL